MTDSMSTTETSISVDQSSEAEMLDVSVLVSTKDRAASLARMLDSLAAQDTGKLDWELIVVDNGSSDDTSDLVRESSDRLPTRLLFEEKQGKNRALNLALRHARGKLFVFTDDDIIAAPNWLRELKAVAHRWPDVSIFGGRIEPLFPEDTPAWMRDPEFTFSTVAFGRYVPAEEETRTRMLPFGANMMLRARLFDEIEFNEAIGPAGQNYAVGGEYELLGRLAKEGHDVVYAPQAFVEHVVREDQITLDWLYGRAFRYGRGRARRSPLPEPPRRFGWLWRKWAWAATLHYLNFSPDAASRFRTGSEMQFWRGQYYENELIYG